MKTSNTDGSLKRIESKEDMLRWAKEVNNGITIKQKCDYQDIWARSNREDLNKFFIENNGDRALILCSIHNTMAYDEIETLLLHLAKVKAQKIIDKEIEYYSTDYLKKLGDITKRENSLKDCLKGYWKRIALLRKSNIELRRRDTYRDQEISNYKERIRKLQSEVYEYKEKADKYDTMKRLLT